MILANIYNSITNTRGQINAIIEVTENDTVYGYESEPVTLDELKAYAKIDFNDEDEIITGLITAARQQLEKFTALSFVPKRLTAILQNDCGGIEIPYGPVTLPLDITLITDEDGNEVDLTIRGNQFPYIESTIQWVQLIYDAGYSDLPTVLKTAIKAQAFFLYENRGEKLGFGQADSLRQYNADYVCNAARILCAKYRRTWDILS